jgi:VWFA-related protein
MTRRELLFAAPLTALAQFTSSVRVVNVFVTVRDSKGALVTGLKREDFDLTEDNRRQEIRYFSSDSDLPLTIGILFDVSGSQRSVIAEQRAATLSFLNKILRDGDSAFLMAFDENVLPLSAPEAARATLENRLAKLDTAGSGSRGTALFDAIAEAAATVQTVPGRKAAVVLSDGYDTASATKLTDAITAAQRANLLVFPIFFYDLKVFAFKVESPALSNLREGKRTLERIAKETGGGFYQIAEKSPLDENFTRMEREFRQQYSLGFTPAAGRSGYRKLRVTVRQKGVTVQARDGYFAFE